MLNLKAPMCNRSVNLKLDGYTLNFVFSDKQNRPFYMTSFEHLHSTFEIHVVIEGSCRLKTLNDDRVLLPNTVVVIPPKVTHFITDFSDGCKKIDLRLSAVSDDGAPAELPFDCTNVTVAAGCERVGAYAGDFYEAMSYTGRNGEVVAKSALTLAYFSLLKELGLDDEPGPVKRDKPTIAYDHVIIEDFLMQNYMRALTLSEVAEATGFTSTHIGRVIKKNYGMSYSELILTMRMTHAKKLLENKEPLSSIAKKLGFFSYNGFALAFKRYFRIPPEEMRRKLFNQ